MRAIITALMLTQGCAALQPIPDNCWVIDRIEGAYLVVEALDSRTNDIPLASLPPANEGDRLCVITKAEEG